MKETSADRRLARFLRKREKAGKLLVDYGAGKSRTGRKKKKRKGKRREPKPPTAPASQEMRGDAIAAYGKRAAVVKDLGFASYADYLKSATWTGIRTSVLSGSRCYGCGGRACQVHHGDYSEATMTGECQDDLYAVCGICHGSIEFSRNGRKRSPGEATRSLERRHVRAKAKATKKARRAEKLLSAARTGLSAQWAESVARD